MKFESVIDIGRILRNISRERAKVHERSSTAQMKKKLNILRIKLKIRMLNFVTCFCVPQIKGLSWLMKYARINLCSNYSRQRDVTMEIKRACLLVWWTLLLAFFAIYTCHDINHFALKFIESSQFFVIACNEIFVLFKFKGW